MPSFVVGYGTGADVCSLLKDDGSVYDRSGTRLCKNVGCDANTRRPYGLMFLFLGFDRLLRSCGLDIAVLMGQIIGYGAE